MEKVFKYMVANIFFKNYCPEVKRYKHKLRNKDSNGKEIEFTKEDEKVIREGLKKLFNDIKKASLL